MTVKRNVETSWASTLWWKFCSSFSWYAQIPKCLLSAAPSFERISCIYHQKNATSRNLTGSYLPQGGEKKAKSLRSSCYHPTACFFSEVSSPGQSPQPFTSFLIWHEDSQLSNLLLTTCKKILIRNKLLRALSKDGLEGTRVLRAEYLPFSIQPWKHSREIKPSTFIASLLLVHWLVLYGHTVGTKISHHC